MKKSIIRWSIAVLMLAIVFGCGYATYSYIVKNYSAVSTIQQILLEDQLLIEIPTGSGTEAIANILNKEGVIKNAFIFRMLSRVNGYDGTYRSGVHAIDKNTNYNSLKGYDILMEIMSGSPLNFVGVRVMIPEGYNNSQIIELLEKANLANKKNFIAAEKSVKFDFKFLKNLPERENRLEGYLFPDTYEFDPKSGEKEIIHKMLKNFDTKFKPEYYIRAEELNMSVDDIIILASIIEREAKVAEERPIIAGVFYNRLRSKNGSLRKLQSCATVQYVLYKREGKMKEIISIEDEKIEDPYNTYLYEGLPPGPICNPGQESIEAALYPKEHDYLYFALKRDGTGEHYFTKTYTEHLGAQLKAQLNAK
ncbi:MAG TPA: endolytic transglycosylase MltG [Clostridiales bacterium]|nr:endolytic transglycosylase MltG [Clostridiales bacterium]